MYRHRDDRLPSDHPIISGMASITVRTNMAFGDWEPSEEYEELVETGWWDLETIHPESCWYTIKATPAERLAHYRDRLPVCEFFACEGVNVNGYWLPCIGPIWSPPYGHLHAWSNDDLVEAMHDPMCGLEGEYCAKC